MPAGPTSVTLPAFFAVTTHSSAGGLQRSVALCALFPTGGISARVHHSDDHDRVALHQVEHPERKAGGHRSAYVPVNSGKGGIRVK